ncbi:hypothetical protein FRB99_005193, partial [Tulasnella sp. 403]
DVPGLGEFGSLQWVNPGRMRNDLFPKGLANYVVKGVPLPVLERPGQRTQLRLNPNASSDFRPVDFAKLKAKLESIPPVVIKRRAITSMPGDASSSSTSQAIFGSVTPSDLAQALYDAHGLVLTPPNAAVSIPTLEKDETTGQKAQSGKIKTLGTFVGNAALKEGGDVRFKFTIVPTKSSDATAEAVDQLAAKATESTVIEATA